MRYGGASPRAEVARQALGEARRDDPAKTEYALVTAFTDICRNLWKSARRDAKESTCGVPAGTPARRPLQAQP
jgi:hypothetical protein